jgi:integrase/recombinase XerD
MKRTRHQSGYLYRKGNLWMLRYYELQVLPDGTIRNVQKAHKLIEAEGDYRSKKAARLLADEFLAPLNDGRTTTQSAMTLTQFVDNNYLPFVEAHKRISTFRGYRSLWKCYLKPLAEKPLRDFRTMDGECMLLEIARKNELTSTTLAHIKAFLSGAFRHAKRQGVLNSENPMRDVVLPKAKPGGDTYAYSLEEITQMLNVLEEPAATIVAAAAFTGARKGELRGFVWENYDGERIVISQSFWRGHTQPPKTKQSRAPVPVIAQLAGRLDQHRILLGNPGCGLMFPSPAGTPVNLDALVVDVIRPAMRNAGLSWHGWHEFRRGLATTLHRLRVPDKTIQAILRHSNVGVTQACYIKTVSDDVAAAMLSLEYAPTMHLESKRKLPVV